MFKGILGYILITTVLFGKDKLEFKIQNGKDKDIEIMLVKKDNDNIKTYHIKYGDTLSELALELKVSIKDLIKLNHIKNKDLIIADDYLKYRTKKENSMD